MVDSCLTIASVFRYQKLQKRVLKPLMVAAGRRIKCEVPAHGLPQRDQLEWMEPLNGNSLSM
jgi:hypothetical protein